MSTEREVRLPKWAQKELHELREELSRLRCAHTLLTHHEWFTLGKGPDEDGESRKLFTLSKDGAHQVCALYKNDVLIVGRSMDRAPWKKAVQV